MCAAGAHFSTTIDRNKHEKYFRAEGALTFECHRRTRSTLVFVCPRVTLIFGFSEIFEIFLMEMEGVPVVLDATVGPVVAPWIV